MLDIVPYNSEPSGHRRGKGVERFSLKIFVVTKRKKKYIERTSISAFHQYFGRTKMKTFCIVRPSFLDPPPPLPVISDFPSVLLDIVPYYDLSGVAMERVQNV